jgi:thioredoxin 1
VSGEILTRLLLALAIAAAGAALYLLVTRLILARAGRRRAGLELLRPGVPAILYFTTPECAPCKTIQRPALQRLQQQLGDRLQVVEVNAHERPDLAGAWGIFSVPATFVIDPSGRPRHANFGTATAEKLLDQLNHIDVL